jgi:hypothetical protein
MDEKSKFDGIAIEPEKFSQAEGTGAAVLSVRLVIVGCVYCVVFESALEEFEVPEMDECGLEYCA